MKHRRFLLALPVLLSVLLAAPFVLGQSQNITGTVQDQTGGAVGGATVRIMDQEKGTVVRELVTDAAGRFQALNVQPATYAITVEFQGFQKLTAQDIKLDVNTKLDVGVLKMQVGAISETVSVTAETTAVVQTNTMEKSYMVEQKSVLELPMNGRNWQAMILTVPGVTTNARTNFDMTFNDVSAIHVGGGRGSQNNFYLDGSPNLDVGDNQSQYTQPSIDSVAEFKVQMSNFNAEYGRNSGMVVAVQTKSGSNAFHGTAYYFGRNDAFDAVAPLRQRQNVLPPGSREKDVLRYHQFGGNFSGWIPFPGVSTRDNKTVFFFYNREMTRRKTSGGGTPFVDLPGPTILSGDFREMLLDTNMQFAPQFKNGTIFVPGSIKYDGAGNLIDGTPMPNNTVPQSLWVPSSANYLKFYKPPYMPDLATMPAAPRKGFKRYYYIAPNKFEKDQDLLRVDYNINKSTTTYFRWVNDDQREQLAGAIWGSQPFPLGPQERPKPGSSWSWNIVKSFGTNIATETILAYMHQSQYLAPIDPASVSRDTLGVNFPQLYPGANTYNIVPDFDAGNNIRTAWGDPGWHNDGKDYSFTENVSWFKGSHSFKFGFHYNRDNKKQTGTWPIQGSINFNPASTMKLDAYNGIANMMMGLYRLYTQNSYHIYPYFRFQSWEGFAQDSWKLSKRFTLEYGIRFQRTTPTYTYKRDDGKTGDEGTFDTWSVDLTQYNASKAPLINWGGDRAFYEANPLPRLLSIGLVNDLMPNVPRGFADTLNLFAPRVGFAWDVLGDGKTAIRGGMGMFHERLRQNNFNFGAGGVYPSLTQGTAGPGNVTQITPNAAAAIRPPSYNIFPKDNVMPTVYSWSIGVQRELKAGFALDLSYMGNTGRHLMLHRQANGLPAGTFLKYPNLRQSVNFTDDAIRPYYGFAGLTAVETSGMSAYHGLLARVSRRFTNRFSMNLNYTWSRAMGEANTDDGGVRNPFNRHQDWAPQSYDRTQVLTIDYVYQFPDFGSKWVNNGFTRTVLNGWQISGITEFSTGLPTTISSNGNMYGLSIGSQNAVLAGDYKAKRDQQIWFDPDAFRRPQDVEWGLGRNFFRLPGTANFDVVIQKIFKITEGVRLNVRTEMYNFFNHTQIWSVNTGFAGDAPGSGISANNRGAFGKPTATRDPRTLQLGAKLTF